MKPRKWPFAFAFLTSTGALVGCVSKPVVSIDHAEVKEVDLEGANLDVYLRIQNPNIYDVQIRRVAANVTVAGQIKLDPVELQPNVWIKSSSEVVIEVPTRVPWTVIPAIVTQTLTADKVTFHIQGEADVTATRALGIEENHYPVDEDGEIPRSVFLDLSSSGIHIGIGNGS